MHKLLIYVLLIIPAISAAQTDAEFQGRPRYPGGLLALRVGAGPTKYLGQFTDQSVSTHFMAGASYSIIPELSVGLGADFGTCTWSRRERRLFTTSYQYQFGTENGVPRSTWYSTFTGEVQFNFFPRQRVNGYAFVGGGITFFNPDDYAQEQVAVRPLQDKFATVTVPLGLGLDVFLFRNLSLNAEWRLTFLFSDDFDAFNSALIARDYQTTQKQSISEALEEGRDGYSTMTVGFKYFLFENHDLDGDLLPNDEEETLGTNPYDADTDGDGLSDYEEIRTAHTDPKLRDSDGDGLNDYVEVMKYRSNPLLADTDSDGIADNDEIAHLKTNPLSADTDGDGLLDAEEVKLGTSPRDADTDKDNLTDAEEVRKHLTNPLVADSDGDGISDFEEVFTYASNPLLPDTDSDGLTDYDEVVQYHSDPLKTDTDGDGLSDGEEIRTFGTNVLNRDTDSDGMPDKLDRCPLLAGSINAMGCADPESQQRPVASIWPAKRMRSVDTLLRIDTLVIREGGIMTLFGVNFEVNKDVIRPESVPILEENAKLFTAYPDMEVEIRGHTDADGVDERNLDLSLKRAQAVKRYLESVGVVSARLTVRGFGETSPVASNETAFGKARNRRIEFFIAKRGAHRNAERQLLTGEPALIEGPSTDVK
jgi:outer membrane protein OmpA-like peptidoglycan-associated protein